MIVQAEFISQAEGKIIAFVSTIEGQIRQGVASLSEADSAIELLNFTESLASTSCPWTEIEKQYWMEYFTDKYHLNDIPYLEYTGFTIPVMDPGSIYATVAQLNTVNLALQSQINALDGRVTALENASLPTDIDDRLDALEAKDIVHDGQIADVVSDLSDHILDEEVHIQPGERVAWDAKVTQAELTAGLSGKSNVGHTHPESDITDLVADLANLQNQIDAIGLGATGATPTIVVGSVAEGPVAIEIDPSSTPENVIFNFTLQKGDTGDAFSFDAADVLANRYLYDAEAPGFVFLATDEGNVYVLQDVSVWSDPIPWKGEHGWTPKLGVYSVDSSKSVFEIIDWIGGGGSKPWPEGFNPGVDHLYLGATDYVTDPALGVNILGPVGDQGGKGDRFNVDQQGSDRRVGERTCLNSYRNKI